MTRLLGTVAVVAMLAVGGCTNTQVASSVTQAQQTQAQIQAGIQTACGDVNGAAALAAPFAAVPQVAAVLTYATASCGTADAVAALVTKAINDPSTMTWAEGIASQINGDVALLKGVASNPPALTISRAHNGLLIGPMGSGATLELAPGASITGL